MVGEDSVYVAGDGGATLAEDSGDAFKLLPDVILYVDRMTLHQLRRSEIGSLEIGVIRFALLLGLLGSVGCRLLVVEQIVCVGRSGAVDSVVVVYSIDRGS